MLPVPPRQISATIYGICTFLIIIIVLVPEKINHLSLPERYPAASSLRPHDRIPGNMPDPPSDFSAYTRIIICWQSKKGTINRNFDGIFCDLFDDFLLPYKCPNHPADSGFFVSGMFCAHFLEFHSDTCYLYTYNTDVTASFRR